MKEIHETLVRLGPGEQTVGKVIEESKMDVPRMELARKIHKMRGMMIEGMRVSLGHKGMKRTIILHNDERMHHYQRRRTSITGKGL